MCEMTDVLRFEGSGFKPMHNVKFLKFYTHLDNIGSNLQLLPDTASLPRMLRLLHWDAYPLTTFPSEFSARNLVELTLRYSNLQILCNRNLVIYLLNCCWFSIALVQVLDSVNFLPYGLFSGP